MTFIYLKVVISSRAFVHNAATEALDHRLTDYKMTSLVIVMIRLRHLHCNEKS